MPKKINIQDSDLIKDFLKALRYFAKARDYWKFKAQICKILENYDEGYLIKKEEEAQT